MPSTYTKPNPRTHKRRDYDRQILSDAADRGVMIGSTCAPYLAGWLPHGADAGISFEAR